MATTTTFVLTVHVDDAQNVNVWIRADDLARGAVPIGAGPEDVPQEDSSNTPYLYDPDDRDDLARPHVRTPDPRGDR